MKQDMKNLRPNRGRARFLEENTAQSADRHRARTYARNRTRLSRRGFDKEQETDSMFILKLVLVIIAGSFWLKFAQILYIGPVPLTGLPVGFLIGLILVHYLEKRSLNRRVFFSVLLIAAVLSYFLPMGIVI